MIIKRDSKFKLHNSFGLLGNDNNKAIIDKKYAEYISQVLNILNFKETEGLNPDNAKFTSSILKSSYTLNKLTTKFIEENYIKAVEIIKYSAGILQLFCGHKELKDVTNNLSLIQLFVYFVYKKNGVDKLITKNDLRKIKNIFWLKLFTGRYDSRQNENSIEDAKHIYLCLIKNHKSTINSLKQNFREKVFNVQDFATENLMTSVQCNKSFEKKNLFTFLKSQTTYYDWDEKLTEINIEDSLELHHIIPLSNQTCVGDSSKKLRNDKTHYLNCPMNKTLIKSSTNKKIGSKDISRYNLDLKKFTIQFETHLIDKSWGVSPMTEVKAKELFKARFNRINSKVLMLIEEL